MWSFKITGWFINRIKMREKKSSAVKDKPIDYISSEEEQEIKLKESKQSFRDLWDSKWDVYVFGVTGEGKMGEKYLNCNCLNFVFQIQETLHLLWSGF